MDVKSAFLNGFISKEVYVIPHHVLKLSKALYGQKQAPRAWYERLNSFLLKNGFKIRKVDTTLFIMHKKHDFLIVKIYVHDIIFGATNQSLGNNFSELMQGVFKMSMMEELKYLWGYKSKNRKIGSSFIKRNILRICLKGLTWTKLRALALPCTVLKF